MARPPEGSEARTETVVVRFTPTGEQYLDAAAGTLTRSAYIRGLVAADVAARRITLPTEPQRKHP